VRSALAVAWRNCNNALFTCSACVHRVRTTFDDDELRTLEERGHALSGLLEGGHIVNATTTLVDQPESTSPSALTSLTKSGLAAVTRSLAIEYASRGIRGNAVALGVIRTPAHDPASYAGLEAPTGRVGEISDVVDGILYLEGATFVIGEILHIDGGQSAGHW
jgi:NAD(P)-dependent dehydrogenase (short-subunit alcohol dehydrogenase family)